MKSLKKIVSISLAVLLYTTLANAVDVGQKVPEFSMKSFNDKGVISQETVKKANTMVVFFNTSCSICRGEIEAVQKLKGKKDFDILFVSIDLNAEKRLPDFLKAMNIVDPVVVDSDYSFAKHFGVTMTPATVLLGKDGKVKEVKKGYDGNPQELVDLLKKF